MDLINFIAWGLLALPLVAATAILLHLHRKHNMAIFASVGSASLCFVIAVLVALGKVPEPASWTWIDLPGSNGGAGVHVEIGMLFDNLSKMMLLIVTGVGLLVHIFSIGYMAHDPSRGRFFGGLSIFMFSMTGIVVATNLIELFIFWEGVGLSSYLLIGFWYQKDSAALAANKAFVCNRLADFGFMIGILTCWTIFGTVSVLPKDLQDNMLHLNTNAQVQSALSIVTQWPGVGQAGGITQASTTLLTLMVLGLFMGCVGKSAMVPLHVWLPDAMEGPTPVSALIHAATMVAAGVYMLCRVYPLLLLSDIGMTVIATVGCFTAIFAAVIAFQQNDIKRILAYSTLSQLGYMVMAVGCGGPDAAMFHLTTHAFFKALLFLAAGSVIHAMHDEQDVWRMGGLFKKIPLTAWMFLIGMLALSGVPPLAGFWSKGYLLEVAYARAPIFYWVGAITAAFTAFYMTRLVVIAFFGKARTEAAQHPHESPPVMTVPLMVLAVLSVFGGFSFIGLETYYHGWKDTVLESIGRAPVALPEGPAWLEFATTGLVAFGILSALGLYWKKDEDPINIPFLANKFYIDELYDRVIVAGQQVFATVIAWLDAWVLEGLIIRGGAYLSVGVGEVLRLFQTGSLQTYGFIFTLGGVVLVYLTLFAH